MNKNNLEEIISFYRMLKEGYETLPTRFLGTLVERFTPIAEDAQKTLEEIGD